MKTKEFIRKAKELGYGVTANDMGVTIYDEIYNIARIDERRQRVLSIYGELKNRNAKELFDLCVEYAKTPIEERKEEEKFYLQKMKSFYDLGYTKTRSYLTFIINDKKYMLSDKKQNSSYQTEFTQKEIDKIKETQHTDLSEFKQIPVEEIENEI